MPNINNPNSSYQGRSTEEISGMRSGFLPSPASTPSSSNAPRPSSRGPAVPGSMTQSEIDARNNSVIARQAALDPTGKNVYSQIQRRPKDPYAYFNQNTPAQEVALEYNHYPRHLAHILWNAGLDAAHTVGRSHMEMNDAQYGIHRTAPLPTAVSQNDPIRNPSLYGLPLFSEDIPNDSAVFDSTQRFYANYDPKLAPYVRQNLNYPDDWMLNLGATMQEQAPILAASALLGLGTGAAAGAAANTAMGARTAAQLQALQTAYPRLASLGQLAAHSAIPGFSSAARAGASAAIPQWYAGNAGVDVINSGLTEFDATGNPTQALQTAAGNWIGATPIGFNSNWWLPITLSAGIGEGVSSYDDIRRAQRAGTLSEDVNSDDPSRRAQALDDIRSTRTKFLHGVNETTFNPLNMLFPGLSKSTDQRNDELTVANLKLFEERVEAGNIQEAVTKNLIQRGVDPSRITPEYIRSAISTTGAIFAQNAIDDLHEISPEAASEVYQIYDTFNKEVFSEPELSYQYLVAGIDKVMSKYPNATSNSALASNNLADYKETILMNRSPELQLQSGSTDWAKDLRSMLEADQSQQQGQEADLTPPSTTRSGVSFTF